ncbi:hypothetical protein V8C42DRAFT_359705 [Trichoderma barbatum]
MNMVARAAPHEEAKKPTGEPAVQQAVEQALNQVDETTAAISKRDTSPKSPSKLAKRLSINGQTLTYMQWLLDHGCRVCGGVPTDAGNNVANGQLTVNYVAKVDVVTITVLSLLPFLLDKLSLLADEIVTWC